MSDEQSAMQAFATGLSAELGVTVVVSSLTFSRRLDDIDEMTDEERRLQATTVTVEFYTLDVNAFSTITTFASSPPASLTSTLTTELGAFGMTVTITALTLTAPTYSS